MQQEEPDDFIICPGFSSSIREIVELVFFTLNISLDRLSIENLLFRPAEISGNYDNPEKAWSLKQLIEQLIKDEKEVRIFLKGVQKHGPAV